MEILMAAHAGFCFGVEKAVNQAYDEVNKEGATYTYGPVIHNETVVGDLEKKGARVIHTIEDLDGVEQGARVVLRSHGVEKSVYEELDKRGISYVDTTCPFVTRIHNIVEKESQEGRTILVIGNPKHPEVQGTVSFAKGPVYVIESPEQAKAFTAPPGTKMCLVAQTTYNYKKFEEAVEFFQQKGYNIHIVNTICNATEERQAEAEEIAGKVDAMIVIGGLNSSNSRKLYEICSRKCSRTYFIQTLDDLHLELPKAVKLVGITAGASTPKNIIEEVQNYVRTNF